MAVEAQTLPLSELSVRITKGTTPTTLGRPFVAKGINFVKSEAISASGNIDPSTFAFIDEDTHAALSRSQLQEGDVLFSMAGVYLGKTAVVPRSILPANTNQAVGIIRLNLEKAEPRFIHYALSSPECRSWVHRSVAQSAQPNFNLRDIGNLPIPALSLSEQRAIAHVLGTLDDKIELNRRMNETLEAMARALFKSWFVDFDPVRAKAASGPSLARGPRLDPIGEAERRDPAVPKPLADLFPASFEDSELGEIPKGWRLAEIGDIANVIDCLHAKKPDRCDVGRPFLQLNNIRDDGLIDMTDTYFINEADYQKWTSRMEAIKGDCVITNVGRVGAVAQIPDGVKAALGRNMTGIRCKQAYQYPTFLIECLLSDSMRQEIERKMDSGTILNALNVRNIPKLRFVQPDEKIMTRFEQAVRPLRRKMEKNLRESRTLAAIRDTLLPKLIAGEVRVNVTTKRYSHG